MIGMVKISMVQLSEMAGDIEHI